MSLMQKIISFKYRCLFSGWSEGFGLGEFFLLPTFSFYVSGLGRKSWCLQAYLFQFRVSFTYFYKYKEDPKTLY